MAVTQELLQWLPGGLGSVVPLAGIVLLLGWTVIGGRLSPLRDIPGPFLARFTRLWYLKQTFGGDFEKTNIELHRKYGSVVRISPREYSIDDPDAIRIIYGHGTKFTKSAWYDASGNPDPNTSDLFTDRVSTRHAANRRKVASLYATSSLIKMEHCVQECTSLIMAQFHKLAATSQPINVQNWMQFYAFDLIGLITLSRPFGLLDAGADTTGMLSSLHQYLRYCASVGVFSELHAWIFKPVLRLTGGGLGHLLQFTGDQIAQRQREIEEQKANDQADFLGKLLTMHRNDPDKVTGRDVFMACIMNIGAGSDTTSISLTAILYYLLKAPKCLEKLRSELDEHAAAGTMSCPVTYKEAINMPYLQAVIKEALRLHPATGLPLGRVVPEGGAVICGRFFPGGTTVGINTWVAHRNREVFGEHADTFQPERWLSSDESRLRRMNDYYIPFGHGSRTCIGKNISLMEISKLIPELVRTFDFTLVNPEERLVTENVWFVKQQNFWVNVRLRAGGQR